MGRKVPVGVKIMKKSLSEDNVMSRSKLDVVGVVGYSCESSSIGTGANLFVCWSVVGGAGGLEGIFVIAKSLMIDEVDGGIGVEVFGLF